MRSDPEKRRRRGRLALWVLAGLAPLSIVANIVLARKLAASIEEKASDLACVPPWGEGLLHAQIGPSGYKELSPPLPAVDVPGIEDLEHKPLLLLYEVRGGLDGGHKPALILYEDGLAVVDRRFLTAEGVYLPMAFMGHVSAEAARRFVRDRVLAPFAAVPERVDLWPGSFDGPLVDVYLRDGRKWLHARVDNLGPGCKGPYGSSCRAPNEVQIIYNWALRLDLPDASRWTGKELPSADYINKVQQAVNGASELARRARSKSDGGTP